MTTTTRKPRIIPILPGHVPSAEFSDCGLYRYVLRRTWRPGKTIVFIGLNPSVASNDQDDRTIRRCLDYASRWDDGIYGTYVMLNLHAYRSTDPDVLPKLADPTGPQNDYWISTEVDKAAKVIVAWGGHRSTARRDRRVLSLIDQPYCLGTTAKGAPLHPLYLLKTLEPQPFSWLPY